MHEQTRKPPVVLLAEDDPGDQELTRRALEDEIPDAILYTVSDGEEAMEYLRCQGRYAESVNPRPDVLLLDLNMPRLDGRQVLDLIRKSSDLRGLPVIVMTTSQQKEDIKRSYELGCNSYITKPIDIAPFLHAVRELGSYWFGVASLPS